MTAPYTEEPVLIEFPWRQAHHHFEGDATVSTYERRPYEAREVWIEAAAIPTTPPAQTAYPGTLSGVVRGISGVPLTLQAATLYGNAAEFLDMVPATYASGAYRPTLRDSAGKTVPYDPRVWVADGLRSRVKFNYGVPPGFTPPFTVDYWRYVGQFAIGSTSVPVAPNDLEVYVSAAGNDTTGTGALGSPFLTLPRALDAVRTSGWNNTAEIRVLSTGGVLAWPGNLNASPGSVGRQLQPLVIRGWNANANPGRTLVFSQAVVSTSADATTGIRSIVGAGPYTSAQIGQRVRFTSGPLASLAFAFGGTAQVDVPIVAVPNGTTLTLAWASTAPVAGNTFVVESLDTSVLIGVFATVRSADRLVLEDIKLTASVSSTGILLAGGASLQFRAAHFVTSANFLLTGYNDSFFTGGGIDNVGPSGGLATTKSIFLDNRAGGGFFTSVSGGPQYADMAFAYAGFVGNGQLTFDGRVTECYFDGVDVSANQNAVALVSKTFFADGCVPIAAGGGHLDLAQVRVGGTLSVSGSATCLFQTLEVAAGPLRLQDSADVSGSALTFSGAFAGARLDIQQGSRFVLGDSLTLPVGGGGVSLIEASFVRIRGDLVSSNQTGFGAQIAGGSILTVDGVATFSTNPSGGVTVTDGSSLVVLDTLNATLNGSTGLFAINAFVSVVNDAVFSNNAGFGVTASLSELRAGNLVADANAQTHFRFQGCAVRATTAITASNGAAGAVGVLLDLATTLSAQTLAVSAVGAEGLLIQNESFASFAGSVSVTATTATTAGVLVSSGSSLNAGAGLTSSSNASGAAGISVSQGSRLSCIGSLVANLNTSHGLLVTSGSEASLGVVDTNSNGGSGIRVDLNSRLTATAAGTLSQNTGDGATFATRAVGTFVSFTSPAGNNGGFGVQAVTGARVQVSANTSSITGTSGNVKVGVNAVTTWATIFARNPANTTDYLAAQNPTQLCEVTF